MTAHNRIPRSECSHSGEVRDDRQAVIRFPKSPLHWLFNKSTWAARHDCGRTAGCRNCTVEPAAAPNLAASQEAIEMKYRRFEGTLMQLSEYLRKTDPARADLLLRQR